MSKLSAAGVLTLGISIYFLSAVLPGAFDNFFTTDTIAWDAGTVALWALIPLAVIAGLVLMFVPRTGGSE